MNKRERIIIGLVLIGCAALVGILAEAISLVLALVVGYLAGQHGLLERFGVHGTDDADPGTLDIVVGLLLIAVVLSAFVHAVAVAAMIAGVAVLIWGVPYWILRDDDHPFRSPKKVDVDQPRLERGDP